ncbi:hypothetical protein DFH09DRAFT_1077485 [Mycena vulgaris]|nr:hypothetical protein DFH09DRAFT_1077485 [Mycena vulgaris]
MHAEPSRVDSRLAEGVNQYNRMPEIYTLGANSFCEWDHQSREQPSHPEPSYAYSSLVAVSQVNEESGTSAWITTPQPNKHLTLWEDQQQTIDSMDHIDAGDSTDNHVQQQLNITDTLSNLESFPDPSEGQRPTPLTTLLTLALRGSSGKKMMTKDLCQALIDRFTWFKEHEADETWKARAQSDSDTLEITLRGHPQFVKTGFNGPIKRGRPFSKAAVQEYYWTLDDSRAKKRRWSRTRRGRREKGDAKANGKHKRVSKEDRAYH